MKSKLLEDVVWIDDAEAEHNHTESVNRRLNRDFSKGRGQKTSEEELYSRYLKWHTDDGYISPTELSNPLFIDSLELERIMYEIYCTAEFFDISDEDALIISDPIFVDYNQANEKGLDKRLDRWNLAKKIIINAWITTPSKLQDAVDTLLALDLDIPFELEKTIWVREHYASNQKPKALTDAFNGIFSFITHKPTIEFIVRKTLK